MSRIKFGQTADDSSLKQWISEEITRQLREMKTQLNHELVEDLRVIQQKITEDISQQILVKISGEVDRKTKTAVSHAVEDVRRDVDARLDKVNGQLVVANNKQLAVVKQNTKELMLAVGQQVQTQVYSRIIGEINEKIVPRVNNMVQWVNYNMQDGGEVVDQYRRAVEYQANKTAPGLEMITNGEDKNIISPHVRLFFNQED